MSHSITPDKIAGIRDALQEGRISGMSKKDIANRVYHVSGDTLYRWLKRKLPQFTGADWYKILTPAEFNLIIETLGNPLEVYEKK